MKTKTEAKRRAILEAAAEVFREVGFERASMAQIRVRLGGSKATLYSYFSSKAQLFSEVMRHAKERRLAALAGMPDPRAEDPEKELLEFGEKLLSLPYSPECIATRRLLIAESGRADFGKAWFEWATLPLEQRLGELLGKWMERGVLRSCDPQTAAVHFLSLLESEVLERSLLGVIHSVDRKTIRGAVRRAVGAFLAGYGPRQRPHAAQPGNRARPGAGPNGKTDSAED